MSRTALFSRDARRDLAALIVNGRLEDLHILPSSARGRAGPGDVYAAKVGSVAPRLDAALLDLGEEEGFLAGGGSLNPGARLLVSVQRAAEGDKAARCRMGADMPGKRVVFTPETPGINVSRRIQEPETRRRLQTALTEFSKSGGFILRTEAAEVDSEILRAEAAEAMTRHEALKREAAEGPPRRLRLGAGLFARMTDLWRGAEAFADAGALGELPEARGFEGDLLAAYDLDSRLAALADPRMILPGGGWMKIEPTLALIAVDVNAGADRMGVNRAAAREIPRQLRLRGLGGAVVVDFAGDLSESDRQQLAKALAAPEDPAWRPLSWGPLGFFEATRRRDRPALATVLAELGGAP